MNTEKRVRANKEGRCAGCEVIFKLDKDYTPEPLSFGDFLWCTNCYERRVYEQKHNLRRENIWTH